MQIVTPNLETLTARVRAIMPELKIDRLERNQEGLINDVLIVNRKYVFRFARNEKYAEILNTELGILDLIRPRVGINVPTPIYRGIDCVVYPFVQGESLTRESIQKMDQRARASIGAQLGDFLYQNAQRRYIR
jgi:hypothetical protein